MDEMAKKMSFIALSVTHDTASANESERERGGAREREREIGGPSP